MIFENVGTQYDAMICKTDFSATCNSALLSPLKCGKRVITSTPDKEISTDINDNTFNDSMYNFEEDISTVRDTSDLLTEEPVSTWESDYYIIVRDKLWELLSLCPTCSYPCMVDIVKEMGTFISVSRTCSNCEHDSRWNSQSFHNDIPMGNIKMAAAIHFNAASLSKTLRVFETLNLAHISQSTYNRYKTTLLQPVVWNCWLEHQRILFDELHVMEGCLELAGDSRSDSPGHSAKYGSYCLMETRLNKIIHFELIQVSMHQIILLTALMIFLCLE